MTDSTAKVTAKSLTFAEAASLIREQSERFERNRQAARDRDARKDAAYRCAMCPHEHGDCADHDA